MKRLYKKAEEKYITFDDAYDFIYDWMINNHKDDIINKIKEEYDEEFLISNLKNILRNVIIKIFMMQKVL